VAIKEFIIGPQNYFEEGYFGGDYTESNVSRGFLECDIDNIKGGRVVTGEYYLDNYIDGTYYHNNSMGFTMAVDAMIVQDATVGLQGYYSEGYYANGYYQSRGSQFFLTAELEIVGEDVFATGNFVSEATMSITVSKTASAESIMAVEFVQVAFGARDRDIDLFAFSEAAISIQIEVTRTTNIAVTAVFDIATDGRRFRDIIAAEESQFDFDAVIERSREFQSETQAAFSFDIIDTKFRPFASDITSSTELAAIISHIEGADIVVNGFADLTAELTNVTKETTAALQSTLSQSTVVGFVKSFNSNIQSTASIIVSSRVLLRDTQATIGTEQALTPIRIDTSNKKFGAGSVIWEGNTAYWIDTEIIWDGTNFKAWSLGRSFSDAKWVWTSPDGLTWTKQESNIPFNGDIQTVSGNIEGGASSYTAYFLWRFDNPGFTRPTVYTSIDGGVTWIAFASRMKLLNFKVTTAPTTSSPSSTRIVAVYYIQESSSNLFQGRHRVLDTGIETSSTSIGSVLTSTGLLSAIQDGTRFGITYTTGNAPTRNTITTFFNNTSTNALTNTTLISNSTVFGIDHVFANGRYALLQSDGFIRSSSTYNTGYTNSTNSYPNPVFIQGLNSNWIVGTTGSTYFGSNVNSLSVSNRSLTKRLAFGSSKYLQIDSSSLNNTKGQVNYSNDFVTWNQDHIDGVRNLPNEITYTSSNVDYTSFKSIDCWMHIGINKFISIVKIPGAGGFDFNLFFGGTYFAAQTSITPGSITQPTNILSNFISNTFNHVRLVKDGANVSLYINGVRRATSTTWPAFTQPSNFVEVLGGSFNDTDYHWIDELLITKTLLNNPNDTTITVPTQPWTNDANTLLLAHYDTDLNDDSRLNVIPSAALTAVAQASVSITVDYKPSINLVSNSILACAGQKSAEIILSAFTNASLTATIDKIKRVDAQLASQSQTVATANSLVTSSAELVSAVNQITDTDRIRDNAIATDSVASQLSVVAKIADFFVNADVVAQMVIDAVKTTDVDSSQSAISNISIDAIRTVDYSAAITSVALIVVSADRIRDNASGLSSTLSLNAVVNAGRNAQAELAIEFITEITTQGLIDVIALVMSSGSVELIPSVTRTVAVALDSEFTQNTETFDSLSQQGSADLDSEFTQTTNNVRTRDVAVSTDSVASQLVAIAKIGQGLITLESACLLSCDAVYSAGANINAESVADVSTDISIIKQGQLDIQSQADIEVEGTTNIVGEGHLDSEFALSVQAQISQTISAALSASTALICVTDRVRPFASLEVSAATMSVTGQLIRDVVIVTEAIATEMVITDLIIGIEADLISRFTVTINTSVLHLDEYVYVIPGEGRSYTINGETRERKIAGESREFTIRR
jgi:hypothetical protein